MKKTHCKEAAVLFSAKQPCGFIGIERYNCLRMKPIFVGNKLTYDQDLTSFVSKDSRTNLIKLIMYRLNMRFSVQL